MKQMNKEELIEYFIERFGDNKIISNAMTKEQIREKLSYSIENVTYNPNKELSGAWYPLIRNLNFDTRNLSTNEENEVIVHELLHILSTSQKKKDDTNNLTKVGLQYWNTNSNNEKIKCWNSAINEGMTQVLSEQIAGTCRNVYPEEKDLYKILSSILGEDTMWKKYFAVIDDSQLEETPYTIFDDEIIAKYGQNLGIKISEHIRKILALSDQQLELKQMNWSYGLDKNGKSIQVKVREELNNTFQETIGLIIENEPDVMKKIDIIIKLPSGFVGKALIESVLIELMENTSFDTDSKLEILQKIKQIDKYSISTSAITKMQETILADDNLTPEQKKGKFIEICSWDEECVDYDKLYDLYVECGIIFEKDFSKRDMFIADFSYLNRRKQIPISEFDSEIDKLKYCQIGEYYKSMTSKEIFDKNGDLIFRRQKKVVYINNAQPVSIEHLPAIYTDNEEKQKKLCQQINEFFHQHILEGDKNKMELQHINFIQNNMLILVLKSGNDPTLQQAFYSINIDGSLTPIQKRTREKINR